MRYCQIISDIIDGYNVLPKIRSEILSKKHLRIMKLITQSER